MSSLAVTIFWALSGVSQACYRELPAGITNCATPNGSFQHEFSGLKWNTLYAFTYRTKDGESEPLPYLTPQQPQIAASIPCDAQVTSICKTCGKKCRKVCPK